MSQPITKLSVGDFIKITETVNGVSVARPWLIIAQTNTNPYGNDKVFCIRRFRASDVSSEGVLGLYDGSPLDLLMENFKGRFSDDVLNAIATSTVKCYDHATLSNYTLPRKFFAPSLHEYNKTDDAYDPSDIVNYTPNPLYVGNDDNPFPSRGPAGNTNHSFRNPSGTSSGYSITEYGTIRNYAPANSNQRPCCNIYATTLVSDEPDEDGYYALIPDPDDPYLYVRFHCSLGTVADMPLKVRVDLTTEGNPEITSLQVCNNYGDASPTWENMTVGEKHTFTNTSKTSDNWEIGVKVEARGENTIRVYEPFAIVQTEVEE